MTAKAEQAFGQWLSVVVSCCQSAVMEVVVCCTTVLSRFQRWSGSTAAQDEGRKSETMHRTYGRHLSCQSGQKKSSLPIWYHSVVAEWPIKNMVVRWQKKGLGNKDSETDRKIRQCQGQHTQLVVIYSGCPA